MEPHAPYFPPESYVEQFYDGELRRREVNRAHRRIYESGPEIADGSMIESASQAEIDAIRSYYAAATKYVDDQIRRLHSELSDDGLLEKAGLFVTADHGEELFDHGDIDHRPKMYEELIHVPLIYVAPSEREANTANISQLTSHLDLAPTVADLLGVERPSQWRGNSFDGILTDASEEIGREHCLAELCHTSGLGGAIQPEKYVGAILTDRWKYIYNCQRDTDELYDISQDPEEQTNLTERESEKTRELKATLESQVESLTQSQHSSDLSDAAKDRLERLGYLQE